MNKDDEIKFLQQLVTENGLSRRKFLSAAMALGVGAMAPGTSVYRKWPVAMTSMPPAMSS